MKKKYAFVFVLLCAVTAVFWIFTQIYLHISKEEKAEKFVVVTSFYPMYIATENIIEGAADEIRLESLSEPQTGCLHDYQLTAEDMKLLSEADVFVINGGGIESFLEEVAEQYPGLSIIDASAGIDMPGENAHVWMSVENYQKQVENIAQGLTEEAPQWAALFLAHADRYTEKLQELREQQEEIQEKAAGTKVISFHEAYEYLAEDYGLNVVYTLNLDEERQVSAGEVADVVEQIRQKNITVILAEELYGSEMGAAVEKETGVKAYYLNTLVRGDYGADSYLEGMQENIRLLRWLFDVQESP